MASRIKVKHDAWSGNWYVWLDDREVIEMFSDKDAALAHAKHCRQWLKQHKDI